MSTKRVFVRLAAVGGKQVEAELRGIGDAGGDATSRLTRDVATVNARLSSLARRAGAAAGAVAAAMAAAGVAITRATVQSANEISYLSQVANTTPEALQRWAAASSSVGIEQDKLADILKDVNDRVGDFLQTGGGPMADFFENIAPRVGVTADQFARLSGPEALQLYVSSLERAGASQQEMTFYLEAMASDATLLLPLLRDNGAAMDALGDRAEGLGAVLDRNAIAAMRRTQIALAGVDQAFHGMRNQIAMALAPTVEALANAFVTAASAGGVINRALIGLLENLGRITSYAVTFATLMGGRWVVGMAAAALSTRGVATALLVMRGALIRTGIGALIVGAGELVFQFTKLVKAAGGVGAALGLLKGVAVEVWNRVSLSAQASWARVESGWASAQAALLDGFQSATDGVTGWANATMNTFEGTFLAVQAIWEALPQVFDRIGAQAINGLIGAMESGLAGITEAVNNLLTLGGRRPEWGLTAPDLSEWKVVVPEAASLGERASDAYKKAFEDNPLEAPQLFGGMAEDARGRAAGYAEAAAMLANAAERPLTAWQALRDAVTGAGDEGTDALDSANAAAAAVTNSLNEAGNAGAGAGRKIADGGKEAATGWQAVRNSLADYAKSAMDWGKGLGETLNKAFTGAESAFRSFVETGKFDFKGLVRSILADLAVLAFKRAVLGPIANALSGIFGDGSVTAAVQHSGGVVGRPGPARQVPALAFAAAPRMHSGGWAGLRSDEVPTILQRGERVLNRREAAQYGQAAGGRGIAISIDARGAQMGVAEQIDARLRAALPQIERIAKQAVADGRRRGHAI